ncbi:MAG: hypothetical protein PHQ23_11650 [Candidatus Wallbacteria bacterium]|nr:hypothetical protein [Candidatus Wallbacteria bacterium]
MNRDRQGQVLMSVVLLAVFFSLAVTTALLFDYIGVVNVRQFIPESFKQYNPVRTYLRQASLMGLSDQEQIKELMKEKQEMLDGKILELKMMERQLELKQQGIATLEDRFRTKKIELDSREAEINSKIEQMKKMESMLDEKNREAELIEAEALSQKDRIARLSRIYERMEAESAAKILDNLDVEILSEILTGMKEKKAAEILNFMAPDKSARVVKKK